MTSPIRRRLRPLHKAALAVEQVWDAAYDAVRPVPHHLTVLGYTGYGNADRVVVLARVLGQRPRRAPTGAGRRASVRAMVRRFATAEVGGVALQVRFGAATAVTESDEEGYVRVELSGHGRSGAPLPQPAEVIVLDPPPGARVTVQQCHVLLADAAAERLIVSDIDDTVLRSNATSRAALVLTTLTGSAATRETFPGTTELFAALRAGPTGEEVNAVAYVSASPWNIYDFLRDFMARKGLPPGPMLLRDFGVDETRLITGETAVHKAEAIDELLATFDLPVVLVGDTGEQDPEIFVAATRRHPGRVEAVLLRHVADPSRRRAVERLAADVDCAWVVGDDSAALAAGARRLGLTA